ncbi:LOW QUALITY PROTEIN: hypothetical protein MAR_007299 [Mya arenaria]|uniref:C2H2-type domain-containing protein n=1 Tax=Mya arenaria TaxID=6604 RepID=A0ABY7DFG4_MYAAR|nr:LOW QUALITY PROTEIN: hypothetical protein MAR_007299 [Mya arenaria]
MKKHEDENNHHCPECLRVFTRRDALDEHFMQHAGQSGGGRKRTRDDGADTNVSHKKQKLTAKDNAKAYYRMDKISEKRIEKFNSTASYYKISVNDIEIRELPNIIKTLKQIFQSIIYTFVGEIPSSDKVRITMDSPILDFPIITRFMSELTVDILLSEIERVLQSYEQFVLDETFGLEFVHVHLPSGSGSRGKPYVDISKMLNNKGSVIQIRNTDELCCARALVTEIARIEKHPQWDYIRKGRHAQKQLALNLHEKAGVPLKRCGIEEIKQFQAVLPNYKIVVLSKNHFNAIIYEGPEDGKPIYLYSHNEHFDVITTVACFLNRSYFCIQCKKGYSNKEQHACNNPCVYCHRLHEDDTTHWEYCSDCNRYFINTACSAMHKQNHDTGTSTCCLYYKCRECGQAINMRKHKKPYMCNETYCKTCNEFVEEDHKCFMQPVDENESLTTTTKAKTKDTKYILFYFECTQDQQLQCEKGYISGVNGMCVNCNKANCGSFEHQPNNASCKGYALSVLIVTYVSIQREQTTQQCCQWLFSEENVGATAICHNFKGYDSYPILQYLHDNAILPEVITNGTKFMSIKVPTNEFLAWFDIHKNDAFDFQYELLKYCRSDVDILRKCRLKFRELFQDITKKDEVLGIDPFEKCLTIASACNLVFRRNFLEHEIIGIIPTHGYRPEEKQSVLAYKWLGYIAHQKDVYIQHGQNVGEKQIGPYKVDGYYETEEREKVVLEMNGCFWHGCNRCFKSNTINSVNDMTMGDLYTRTMDKQQYVESLGYTYVTNWECDFKKEIQDVPGLQEFIKSVNIVTPLEPRDPVIDKDYLTYPYGY